MPVVPNTAAAADPSAPTLEAALQQHFGLSGFRPGQRPVIETVLAGGSGLAVMPTGAGKSLCYQFPAMMLSGITIVVSPLISLMKDQVDALVANKIAAIAINSHDTFHEMQAKLDDVRSGNMRLVYVAPERLRNAEFVAACRQGSVSLLAVDEAHCVSQWGHDFRPDYRVIPDFREQIGMPPLLALTATATRQVQDDIATHLGIEDAPRYTMSVDRPNLWIGVERCQKVAEKRGKIITLARQAGGSTIVYVTSRREAEELAAVMQSSLDEPVAAYHGGMPADERTAVQNQFMAGLVRVVTATNAFGMGIDKPDIRAVIHGGIPDSMEAYFQEIGRAGRDGEPATCTMVVVPGMDVRLRQYILEKDEPTKDEVAFVLRRIESAGAADGLLPLSDDNAALTMLVVSYLQKQAYLEPGYRTTAGLRLQVHRPFTADTMATVWREVQQHTEAKQRRFGDLRRFVWSDTCRRRTLLQYFGEADVPPTEACCSACHPRPVEAAVVPGRRRAARRTEKPVAPSVTSDNPALFEALREWRRTVAQERNVPAYVVFGDKDLAGIASRAPENLRQLAACRGVGPAKLELYGEDVLRIVRDVAERGEGSAASAEAMFAQGVAWEDVAERLEKDPAHVWQQLLQWIVVTPSETWKKHVRSMLAPDDYVSIRSELRGRLHKPVPAAVSGRFSTQHIDLTKSVMERVGEK